MNKQETLSPLLPERYPVHTEPWGTTFDENVRPGPEVSIIIPTFNERTNVSILIKKLNDTLGCLRWEVIFVDDDSPDQTASVVREIGLHDHRVRCIQRIGRRGLSSACFEGMLSSSAPMYVIMDGDLQHDETLVPQMVHELQTGDFDLVIGSRYVAGGGVEEWNASRLKISRYATRLSRFVINDTLNDPMSGFFAIRRDALHQVIRNTSGIGFKVLLDIVASASPPLRFKELPYTFRNRVAGESKLDHQAAWDYLMLLADKLVGRWVPVRFLSFVFVGALGIAIHFAVLSGSLYFLNTDFVIGQTVATLTAMTQNFVLNNLLTYRDKCLSGWSWIRGWVSFCLSCSVGAIANIGIASYLYDQNTTWEVSALAGVLVGTMWNFAVTSFYTWGKFQAK